MKRILFCLIVLSCFGGWQTVAAQGKQKVSVLYVGGSADMETAAVQIEDSVALQKSIQERMASFSKFLKSRFKKVKVVHADDYDYTLSDNYDVTIFDGKPKTPLYPQIMERDANGRVTKFARPGYLPFNFSRPVLCIANASEDMGRRLGTKNDWYCLCLDADAHHWVKEHPIFQGPWKVKIEPVLKPTPAAAKEAAKMEGVTLPEQIEMWTVQTRSYVAGDTYRIGMVSRPGGYLDSPEAEFISGGVSAKSIDAVAIGRHGNFFHWGFSASPKYLTKAGQNALANAIVYISKFADQHIIARKLNDGIATRDDAKSMQYLATREAWQEINEMNREFKRSIDSIANVARAKQAKGEKLTGNEKIYLNYQMPETKEPTYGEYLKQRFPSLYHVLGNDAEEYKRYFEKNVNWFRPDDAQGYYLDIDEDVRTIGIPNNDIRLLDRCITMLEKGEEPELATRVLHRYTLCRFATPAEWRNWYDTYKGKMFFTESGGWLFLINTQDRSVPGNDYTILEESNTQAAAPALSGETDPQNPVLVSADLQTTADGDKEIVVRMKIHEGYHTYATVDSKDPFVKTEVSFTLPEGYQLKGGIVNPAPQRLNESQTTVYKGDNTFRQKIVGSGKGTITCTITYQCCNNNTCLIPEEKEMTIEIK